MGKMTLSICPENCEYIAEGNNGIVVRLIKEGSVLKLIKKDDTSKTSPNPDDILKELESEIKTIENVLKPIIGESFINNPVIVFLKADEIHILNEVVSRFRPDNRKHKIVKEEDTYACMMKDYSSLPGSLKFMPTYGPELCIEIKPKQGFIKEEYFSSQTFTKCRYCVMQSSKNVFHALCPEVPLSRKPFPRLYAMWNFYASLKNGKITSISGYCPTDLFSGCHSKMLHALKMLFKTPQNNLRIIKDQKIVYSEEKRDDLNQLLSDFVPSDKIKSGNLLCDLILQALKKPFSHGMKESPVFSQNKFSRNCINAHKIGCENDHIHKLPSYCVLERILSAQLLDDLNMADLYQLYLQVKESKDRHSDVIGCYSRSDIPPFIGKLRKALEESEYQYASRKIWEFLLSLVIKDCSIMVTLKHLALNSSNTSHCQNVISDKYGNFYVFSIAVADLDVKPLERVEKFYNEYKMTCEAK